MNWLKVISALTTCGTFSNGGQQQVPKAARPSMNQYSWPLLE
jgi:hypothetical protein